MKNRFLPGLFAIGLLFFIMLFFNSSAMAAEPYFLEMTKNYLVLVGDTLEFQVIAKDNDAGDILTITKEGPGELVSVPHTSPDTGFYSWTPELTDTIGKYDIFFYVNDGTGNEDTASVLVTVVIADTIKIDCLEQVDAQTTVTIDIRLWNDETICGWAIPLTFYNPLNTDVICDSVQWSSTFWSNKPNIYSADIYNVDKVIVLYSAYFAGDWPTGDNLLATLHFTTDAAWDTSIGVKIDSTFYPPSSFLELVNCGTGIGTPMEFLAGCLNTWTTTDVPESPSTGITGFVLAQNYPNPFNLKTNLSFEIPYECRVSLKIYNLVGRLVNTLIDGKMEKGQHTIFWDGTSSSGDPVASGIYFYKLTTSDFVSVKKMVLLK
jgi:hypothetical protein